MDDALVDEVRRLVETEQKTIPETARELKLLLEQRGISADHGFSVRNLKRFMQKHGISRTRPISEELAEQLVQRKIIEVGRAVGVKMMYGYLKSGFGVSFSFRRILRIMRKVDPNGVESRQHRARRIGNPGIYRGRFFGYNLHMDQNEKLVHYGVTLVMAVDGHSGFIAGSAVMAIKNNIVIYDKVFREAIEKYGLWQRVLVDRGQEFALTLYMQQALHGITDPEIILRGIDSCYKQMPSTLNNRIERFWVDVNEKVLYPVKYAIDYMAEYTEYDFYLEAARFSMGAVCRCVVNHGFQMFVQAWNSHRVRRRGVPETFLNENNAMRIDGQILISGDAAAERYRADGGSIQEEHNPVGDPLAQWPHLQRRRNEEYWIMELPQLQQYVLSGHFLSVSDIFMQHHQNSNCALFLYACATNELYWVFAEAIKLHFTLTMNMYHQAIGHA